MSHPYLSNVNSLGYKSDLMVLSFGSSICAHADCIQVITRSNPMFYWGNFLLFPTAPKEGDFPRWTKRFQDLFSDSDHVAFGWDVDTLSSMHVHTPFIQPFIDAQYAYSEYSVMTATKNSLIRPKKRVQDLAIHPLVTENHWKQAYALQKESAQANAQPSEYIEYKQPLMLQHRKNTLAGHGNWYGAFIKGELVAGLGIFYSEEKDFKGICRFQSVETKKQFRRRGVASHLVYHVSLHALKTRPNSTLVIVVEVNQPAVLVYQAVGFKIQEYQFSLEKSGL